MSIVDWVKINITDYQVLDQISFLVYLFLFSFTNF